LKFPVTVRELFGNIFLEELRAPEYSRDLAAKVRAIRKEDQMYSGKKIRTILLRAMHEAYVPSVSTLSRLINRENLFFRPGTKLYRQA
jgi:hypothetical protein